MLALYNALCTLLWPLLWFYAPFRGSLPARLGRGLKEALDAAGYSGGGPRVLVNAVSAGEVVAISSFVRELRQRLPQARIVLLTTTESGREMARQKLGGVETLSWYFPLADLHFVVRRYLDLLRPDLYITTESELWPNIQAQCRARGIPVALVNARLYLHNKRGIRGAVVRALYRQLDLIVCQSERQRENFAAFGIDGGSRPRVVVSGNTKFDFAIEGWDSARTEALARSIGLPQNRQSLIVAGSTHEGEEALLLDEVWDLPARSGQAGCRLILAPRHVERAAAVAELARNSGLTTLTLSQAEAQPQQHWKVLVVDRYGVLVDMYRLADVVVMGGTFNAKVGGHNLLEATALGKPVVCGPSTFGITAQVELLREAQALVEAPSALHLAVALIELLDDPGKAAAIGQRAREVTLANRGASARAADEVLGLLDKSLTQKPV